jgi:hypothetical protein
MIDGLELGAGLGRRLQRLYGFGEVLIIHEPEQGRSRDELPRLVDDGIVDLAGSERPGGRWHCTFRNVSRSAASYAG